MSTIQVADKPTLDAVKNKIDSLSPLVSASGGAYTGIKIGLIKYGEEVSVTGKGSARISAQIVIKSIDGITTPGNLKVKGIYGNIDFKNSLVLGNAYANSGDGEPYIIYLY